MEQLIFILAIVAAVAFAACFMLLADANKTLREDESALLFEEAVKAHEAGREVELKEAAVPKDRLSRELASAGINRTAANWRALQFGCATVAFMLVLAISLSGSSDPVKSLVGCGVLSLVAAGCVVFAFKMRLKKGVADGVRKLEKQLAQAELQIAENSRSGLSVTRSVLTCMEQSQEPLKGQLQRVYNEIAYTGIPLSAAMENMAARLGSKDVKVLAAVIKCQEESGSSLADALEFLHDGMKKKVEMRQALRTELAETKITRAFVAITPWFLFVLLSFGIFGMLKMDGFWDFYTTTVPGFVVLGVCIAIEAGLLAIISRMIDMDIE